MALTHHVIVKVAAFRAGITGFWDYAILGDDVVIANDWVAAEYRELLRELDMPISAEKTHVSDDTYEFAKRWIHRGVEVTPFSVQGILETWKQYSMFSNTVDTQLQHGWKFRDGEGPGSFLLKVMRSLGKSQQAKRSVKLLNIYTLLQSFIRNPEVEGSAPLRELLALPDNED